MKNNLPLIAEVPETERSIFDRLIQNYREVNIRSSQSIVDLVFEKNDKYAMMIKSKQASQAIKELREVGWHEYLKDEVNFNALLMKELHHYLETPKEILDALLNNDITKKRGEELKKTIIEVCGEYAGRVFPYLYRLC